MRHSTAQHSTAQHGTAQHFTINDRAAHTGAYRAVGSLSAAAGGETDDVSCELRPMGCITGSPSAAGCETDDVS